MRIEQKHQDGLGTWNEQVELSIFSFSRTLRGDFLSVDIPA